jgi:hypothetical protein
MSPRLHHEQVFDLWAHNVVKLELGALYRHTASGMLYSPELLALDEATLQPMVVYRQVGDRRGPCWVRPLPAFLERFTLEKAP